MRRKDRQTTTDQALGIVDSALYGVLSMTGDDGAPYCVPLTFVREGDYLFFHCAAKGYKLTNLRRDNRVCISFVSSAQNMPTEYSTWYESATVKGIAEEIERPEEKIRVLRLLVERHIPQGIGRFDDEIAKYISRTLVLRIKIQEITGKAQQKPQ